MIFSVLKWWNCRDVGSLALPGFTMSSRGLLAAQGHFGPLLPRLLRARGSFCVNGRQSKRSLVATGDLAARGGNGVWQTSTEARREYSQLRSSRELALSKPFLLQRYQVGTLPLFVVGVSKLISGASMAVWGRARIGLGPFSSLAPSQGSTCVHLI